MRSGRKSLTLVRQMFKQTDIQQQLSRFRKKQEDRGDNLVSEAQRILKQDLFTEKKILSHLGQYNRSFELLDEESLDDRFIFSPAEIKKVCIHYRLKFLESKVYKPEIPYEAILKIKGLNSQFHKDIKEFKIMSPAGAFTEKENVQEAVLFAGTNYGNYYLVHRWGQPLPWYRLIRYWHMRYFENLFFTVIAFTLLLTLSLPIGFITLDNKADYWSGYRAAAFFHLLIFNMGVTAYTTFAFARNFSSTVWNREQDFG